MSARPVCTVLLLTEDSGAKSFETLREVFRVLVRLIDPGVNRSRIRFVEAVGDIWLGSKSTYWKSKRPKFHQVKVKLAMEIARRLLSQDGFVVFHVDSDCTWANRSNGQNSKEFEDQVLSRVRAVILDRYPERSSDIDEVMRRLILLMPHYSIESWLYQNTAVGARICDEKGCGRCKKTFGRWSESRGDLDEVSAVKERTCFGSDYNLELANNRFPAREAQSVGKSFTWAVETVKGCSPFMEAIERSKIAV